MNRVPAFGYTFKQGFQFSSTVPRGRGGSNVTKLAIGGHRRAQTTSKSLTSMGSGYVTTDRNLYHTKSEIRLAECRVLFIYIYRGVNPTVVKWNDTFLLARTYRAERFCSFCVLFPRDLHLRESISCLPAAIKVKGLPM